MEELHGIKCETVSQSWSASNFDQEELRGNSLVFETRMQTAVAEKTELELLELDGPEAVMMIMIVTRACFKKI